jgi:hypothetical protein
VEREVVFAENASVDPPVPKAEIMEKVTEIVIKGRMVEKIVHVEKAEPKLSRWKRVRKLGKLYPTLIIVEEGQ